MAEALAVAGLIFSIFEVAQRVHKIGKAYLDAIKDGKRTLYSVLIEVSSVKEILECLQDLVQTDPEGSRAIANLLGDDGPIEGCRRALAQMEELLTSRALGPPPTGEGDQDNSWRARCRQATRAVTWPATLETIQRLQREICQYKTTMTLALQTNTVADIKQVKQGVNEVLESISETQLRDTCDWLESTNPSFRHNEAANKHEPHTSDWISRTAEWREWSSRNTRFLWVHGIPGAGKTVLTSFLVHQLKSQYADDYRTAVTYYYCYFGNNQDETGPFLAWILSQLCRKVGKIPSSIMQLRRDSQRPSDRDLCEAVKNVLPDLDAVYVVIDAVDESKSRENLVDALTMLATDDAFRKIQLLATSREYQDLEDALRPISTSLSLSHGEIDKDIRTYIHSQLERKPGRIKTWSATLLRDVEDTLATQAKGMFQWAFCQVKRLERLPSYREPEIRKALATLPETLYDTYERILLEIPEGDMKLARDTLLFMYCYRMYNPVRHSPSGRTPRFDVSRDYILYELEPSTSAIEQSRVFSDSCGCLIRDVGRDLEFTHYTVSEFLASEHLASHTDGGLRYYSLQGNAVHCEYTARLIRTTGKLQSDILSRHPTLPRDVCDPAPEFVHDLHWPVVAIGATVQWLRYQPTLTAPLTDTAWRQWKWKGIPKAAKDPLIGELSALFRPEQGTIIPRFIPWCNVGDHWWCHYADPTFEDMESFRICHDVLSIRRDIKMIINCALLGYGALMATELEGNDMADLLDVEVTLRLRERDGKRCLAYLKHSNDANWQPVPNSKLAARTVSGNLVSAIGAYEQYLWFDHGYAGNPVATLIEAVTTPRALIPLSDALMCYLSSAPPSHYREVQYKPPRSAGRDALARVLDDGADPNCSDYVLTPLQLAVGKSNTEAVELLLSRGADPNGTGKGAKTMRGEAFGKRWRNASPLRISRRAPHPLEELYPGLVNPRDLQKEKSTIEGLLVEHGARDFELGIGIRESEAPARVRCEHIGSMGEHIESIDEGISNMAIVQ